MSRIVMLLFFSFFSPFAQADRDTSAANAGYEHVPESAPRARVRATPAKRRGAIHGKCTIIETLGNTIESPCANYLILLFDESGKELARTRADRDGLFDFPADSRKLYHLGLTSKLYDIVAPKNPFYGGSTVELRIQAK